MALYGEARDISMFRYINRELMHNIISQQCVLYKVNATETKTNMYGEASMGRVFQEPILLFALIEREDQTAPTSDFGVGFEWPHVFKFLRDDLLQVSNDNPNGANVQPEIGDFIMWQNAYWEIDNTNLNQLFVGKDPQYPYTDANNVNPLESDLNLFGYNVAVECLAHYVPADRVNVINQRL
jgi:hypothetical protein